MRASRLVFFFGSSLVLLGGLVLFGWLSHQPALIQLVPGFDGMPYSTALGLVLAGCALIAARRQCFNDVDQPVALGEHPPNTTLPSVLAILLILLGVMALIEWLTNVALGLSPDLLALRQWLTDTNPYAGRMRPLAAVTFIAIGLVLFWLPRTRVPRMAVAMHSLILLIGLIGFLGVLGQLAGFAKVFSWYLGPVLTAGGGFILCALGLFVLLQHHPAYQTSWGSKDGEKISLVIGPIIVVTGLVGIFGGFAVLYPEAVGQRESNLALSLQSRSDALHAAIQQGWQDSNHFGNQPLGLEAMQRLNQASPSPEPQAHLRAVAERYRAFGFSAVVFRDASGREVARAGAFVADPALRVTVQTPSPSELLWQQGFVLHTYIGMTERGALIGTLEAERPLAVGEQLHDTAHFGTTLDFIVCAPAGSQANCFPFRSGGWKVLRDLPLHVNGQPIPISYAVTGQSGVIQTTDYRGVQVIAAHAPIGKLGLGAVLKIDAAELFQPIAQRLGSLLVMLLAIAVASIAMLHLQVVPLVRRMIQEIDERKKVEARAQESEAKLAEITATLGEGVYVLDEAGLITFINLEAERLLGWTAAELLGKDGHHLFHFMKPDGSSIATSDCLAHQAIRTGQNYRGLNDWFVRKDGTFLPVSIVARPIIRAGVIKGSVTSFEDLTPRLAAENALRESEERFRTTLEHAPIGMGIVSADWHFLLVNRALCNMLGYAKEELETLGLQRVTHPDDQEKTQSLLQRALQGEFDDYRVEKRYLRKDGEIIWGQLTASVVKDASGKALYIIAQIEDISVRKSNEEQIRHLAYYDFLTDLPNRRLFFDRLNQALIQAKRHQHLVAVLYLDLDRFKEINDTLGHDVGDQLLVAVAARLRHCVRGSDTVCRLGGDEFAIVLSEVSEPQNALTVADKIIASMKEPVRANSHQLKVSTSIGIAICPVDEVEDAQALIKKADIALYEAKAAGRDCYHLFGTA